MKNLNIERFFTNIKILDNNCWGWSKAVSNKGYGRFTINKKAWFTHRISYILFNGEIPNGKVIDHICKNRICCNPDHLRCVSKRENTLENSDGLAASHVIKTHCKNNHEFSISNTRFFLEQRQFCGAVSLCKCMKMKCVCGG